MAIWIEMRELQANLPASCYWKVFAHDQSLEPQPGSLDPAQGLS
jgi:hypothetical protein